MGRGKREIRNTSTEAPQAEEPNEIEGNGDAILHVATNTRDTRRWYEVYNGPPLWDPTQRLWGPSETTRRVMTFVHDDDIEVLRRMCASGGVALPEAGARVVVIAVFYGADGYLQGQGAARQSG